MGRGFGYSIYFMLTLLFGIAAIITFVVWRTIAREEKLRREREERRRRGEDPAPGTP